MTNPNECYEYLTNGDFERAINCLTQLIKLNPKNAWAFFNRGAAKGTIGQLESALSDYDRAIELDPNNTWAFTNRGFTKVQLQRYKTALPDYDRAIELNSYNVQAIFYRGNVKSILNNYESALHDYNRVIEFAPKFAQAFISRGIVKVKLCNYESALLDFDEAISLGSQCASDYYSRGVVNDKLSRYKSALDDYNLSIKLDPSYPPAFINRGIVKVKLHHYESALNDYDQAIKLDSSNTQAFYNRGNANLFLRKYESALHDYERAIELEPLYSLSYFGKANALWKGSNDIRIAHLYFNRFIFLATPREIIEAWNAIIEFYSLHTTAPFLLSRLFELLPSIGKFYSLQGTLHENERQCRILKNYLDYLRNTGEPQQDASQFYRLEALINYFLGDPMEAYRIYNTLDSELKCLTLMDSYYFLLSASDFIEPAEDIRRFGLQKADDFLNSPESESNIREIYYAGQLYILEKDWVKAFEAFRRAQSLFPAVVMQAVLADRLNKPLAEVESLWEKAKLVTTVQLAEMEINPFSQNRLKLGQKDYLFPFQQYANFREIAEYMYLIMEGRDPFHDTNFWEVWQFSPADEQEIWWQLRKKELEKIEDELQSFFTRNLEQRYASSTEDQLKNLEIVLRKKNKAVQSIFEKLQQEAAISSEALEHQMGLEIDHWGLHSAHAYALLLKYFFLSRKLADKPTLLLYFYIDFTATKKQRDYAVAKEAFVEGSQPVFSILINTLLKLGDVVSAVVAGALSVLTQRFFNQSQEPIDEDDPTSNYQKFKAAFLKFLSFEIESMGREKFFKKYPLEGWDDWKK